MAAYEEILRLTIDHAYYGDADSPITVTPSDPATLNRHGLKLRQTGRVASVLAPADAQDLPCDVQLTLNATAPDVMAVSDGMRWDGLAQIIHSTTKIAGRARASQKFMLQERDALGSKTLIPVLPAGGTDFKPAEGGDGLQTDIYVSLF